MVGQVGSAADRSGGHHRSGRQVDPSTTHQCVTGVGPFGNGYQNQALGGGGRQVFGRVDGNVGPTVKYRCLDLDDEHTLATHLVDGGVEVSVASRGDDNDLGFGTRNLLFEKRSHPVGLPAGQGTASGG